MTMSRLGDELRRARYVPDAAVNTGLQGNLGTGDPNAPCSFTSQHGLLTVQINPIPKLSVDLRQLVDAMAASQNSGGGRYS